MINWLLSNAVYGLCLRSTVYGLRIPDNVIPVVAVASISRWLLFNLDLSRLTRLHSLLLQRLPTGPLRQSLIIWHLHIAHETFQKRRHCRALSRREALMRNRSEWIATRCWNTASVHGLIGTDRHTHTHTHRHTQLLLKLNSNCQVFSSIIDGHYNYTSDSRSTCLLPQATAAPSRYFLPNTRSWLWT